MKKILLVTALLVLCSFVFAACSITTGDIPSRSCNSCGAPKAQ